MLEGGLEYKPFASENSDAQLNETMAAIVQQICGTFRIPTWKIGDLSRATYSNMSAGELSYITSTLDPFFEVWEEAIRLTADDPPVWAVHRYVRSERAHTFRPAGAAHRARDGHPGRVLLAERCAPGAGLNPIPDGDRYMVNSALVPIADVGDDNADPVVA